MKISDAKLAELEALAARNTSNEPLTAVGHCIVGDFQDGPNPLGAKRADCMWEVDARLYAAATNALPDLIADLRETRAQRDTEIAAARAQAFEDAAKVCDDFAMEPPRMDASFYAAAEIAMRIRHKAAP